MKLTDLRIELQEMLCAHEAFRRLGFAPDDIYIGVGLDPKYGEGPQVFVELHVHGTQFNLRTCDLWCDEAALVIEWPAAVLLWNDPAQADACQTIWDQSEIRARSVELTVAVLGKGISLPRDAVRARSN